MDPNSPLFDRIRVKSKPKAEAKASPIMCDHPGCSEPGAFKAPMGRLREGQYFNFCLDHVREYNSSYNYFNGMSDHDVARYQKDAVIGHRPTWSMGVNRAGTSFSDEEPSPSHFNDPLGIFRARQHQTAQETPKKPRYGLAVMKALSTLGLDETADADVVKTRYKELVKRLHPDANGGDRSYEDKLREIIQAYNYLKSAKLA
jgi:curved DNA-binding protein CbpA